MEQAILTDRNRGVGSDSVAVIDRAEPKEDHQLIEWSKHVEWKVESFDLTPDERVPVSELVRLGAGPRPKINPLALRPYLPEAFGGSDPERIRRNMVALDPMSALLDGIRLGDLSAEVLEALTFAPSGAVEGEGNLLVNQGIQRFEDLLIAVAVQGYDNTHCRLGVGNDATAAAAGNTDLTAAAGSGNRQFVVMDSTFPSRASQTLSFKATHTTGLSNFAWAEWGIDNGTANGTTVTANLLNHKVTSLGTKTSAASWAFTVTVVLS